MPKQSKIMALLTEILKSVDAVGLMPTIDLLKNNAPAISADHQKTIQFIIASACLVFNISRKELIEGGSVDIRVQARSVCFYLIRTHTSMKQSMIGQQFKNTDQASVSRGIRYVMDLDAASKVDQQIIFKKDKIDLQLKNYLQANGE